MPSKSLRTSSDTTNFVLAGYQLKSKNRSRYFRGRDVGPVSRLHLGANNATNHESESESLSSHKYTSPNRKEELF